MKQLWIPETKDFMAKLLTGNAFDCFLLQKATVVTFQTVTIDGRLQKAFFEEEADLHTTPFVPFYEVRPLLLSLIRGKRPPLSMQLVLMLREDLLEDLPSQDFAKVPDVLLSLLQKTKAFSFIATIAYDENGVRITSGVAMREFTTGKSIEAEWDDAFSGYLKHLGIASHAD